MAACIGIRREDKSAWERRAPLIPDQVRRLGQEAGVHFIIQPSTQRIFDDAAYRAAGAGIDDDLSPCAVILGIKEMPPQIFEAGKTYVFFSHTIKGQPYNMQMLRRLLDLRCQLIDYERIADAAGPPADLLRAPRRAGRHDRCAVGAGPAAGLGGDRDAVRRRCCEPGNTKIWRRPGRPCMRPARRSLGTGLPAALEPLIVGFAGYGNVSRGAQEIFDLLPFEELAPADLAGLFERLRQADHRLYKVVFRESDTVEPRVPCEPFELLDYYQHPERYRSRFESYLPYLTVLINAIYWEPRYPRLVTRTALRQLYASRRPYLRIIGDISCDVDGAIEPTDHHTQPDAPAYVYQPLTGAATPGVAGAGPAILAVDILPAELPRESSEDFGKALAPFVPALAAADFSVPFEDCRLPEELRRAVVCYHGELTPGYRYLEKHVGRA